LLVLL